MFGGRRLNGEIGGRIGEGPDSPRRGEKSADLAKLKNNDPTLAGLLKRFAGFSTTTLARISILPGAVAPIQLLRSRCLAATLGQFPRHGSRGAESKERWRRLRRIKANTRCASTRAANAAAITWERMTAGSGATGCC